MKAQNWIFSIRHTPKGSYGFYRRAVVGPACVETVEAALGLVESEAVRTDIRADTTVRQFIEGRLSPEEAGYCSTRLPRQPWIVCIGPVHEVL